MNSLVLAIIGIAMMGAGYLLYSTFLGKGIFRLSPNYSTPAHTIGSSLFFFAFSPVAPRYLLFVRAT